MTTTGGPGTVRKPEPSGAAPPKEKAIELPRAVGVRQLAELLSVTPVDIIKRLMKSGIIANINQVIDYKTASTIAKDLGYQARAKPRPATEAATALGELKKRQLQVEETSGLQPRPPVVTIMGHVDHGKTRLLDAIRQTHVMESEVGGITQHIGAYQVEYKGQKITFLDTPGHEAFTAMRARGAQVTDITVLVVAADDGVMPQTLEAINHARAAGVPIVVAINKIDKPGANPDHVKQQLADIGLVCEEWGGDTVCVPTSAREKKGISDLLENILAVAEMEELKASPTQAAVGVVIEASLDKTRGPLATVLVHAGNLKVGDIIAVGTTWGRVKAMFNDAGKQIRRAGPSTPAVVLGLSSVPQAGDALSVVPSEHQAQAQVQRHQEETKEAAAQKGVSLDTLFAQISAGKVKELNVILKVDVEGSLEPIRNSLEQLGTDQIKVRIIHSGSGNITENDVLLATASKGLIIGFNTGVEPGAKRLAEAEGVDIRRYDIIYNLIDDVSKALKGLLEPIYVEVIDGRAEIRAVFPSGKKDKAAGVIVREGKIVRGGQVRVIRAQKVIATSMISSLKRFKEDVREVATGYECGVGLQDFSDFQVGDSLEIFHREKAS